MAEKDLVDQLKEAAYVSVGLGVLGAQRLLVGRRELAKRVEPQLRGAASQLQRLATATDEKLNPVLHQMEERLPGPTRDVVRSARGRATGARDAVLSRVASQR